MDNINYEFCPHFTKLINKLYLMKEVKAVFLCGSRANNTSRIGSDYDLLVLSELDLQKLQVVHYNIKNFLLDIMLLDTNFIFSEKPEKKRLIKVLLAESKVIFSKSKEIQNKISNVLSESDFQASELEIETIWYTILWNIKKAKSFVKINKCLSNQLCMEAQYFIGLFFAKLNGKEIYNFCGSLEFMCKEFPDFFKKYSSLNNEARIRETLDLIQGLPHFKKYSSLESFAELEGFVSPHTVIKNFVVVETSTKKSLDKIIFSGLI